MQKDVQTDAKCNIQQCWELLPKMSRSFMFPIVLKDSEVQYLTFKWKVKPASLFNDSTISFKVHT